MRSCLKKEKAPEEVDTILGNTGSQRETQTVTKTLGKSIAVFSVITRSDRGQDSRYCWQPWRASPWAPGIFMSGIRVPALTRKGRKLSGAATAYHQQLSPGQLFLPRKTLKHGLIGMMSHQSFYLWYHLIRCLVHSRCFINVACLSLSSSPTRIIFCLQPCGVYTHIYI